MSAPNRSDVERRQRHRAAQAVARQARDPEELLELLDMLGLTDPQGQVPPQFSC